MHTLTRPALGPFSPHSFVFLAPLRRVPQARRALFQHSFTLHSSLPQLTYMALPSLLPCPPPSLFPGHGGHGQAPPALERNDSNNISQSVAVSTSAVGRTGRTEGGQDGEREEGVGADAGMVHFLWYLLCEKLSSPLSPTIPSALLDAFCSLILYTPQHQ